MALRPLLSSLRVRLLGLVLLVTLPALALVLHEGLELRRSAEARCLAETRHLTYLASARMDHALLDATALVEVLARRPEVLAGDPAACASLFRRATHGQAVYLNVGLADARGDVVASALPLAGPVNARDRSWFRDAIATGQVAVGEFQVGRITGKPSLNLGCPVTGPDGRLRGVVFTALDLAFLSASPLGLELPRGAMYVVVDRKGTVLVRRPDPEGHVGHAFPQVPIVRTALARHEGSAEDRGIDGVLRLWTFRPLAGARAGGAYALLGMDRRLAFAAADRATRDSTALLLLVSLAGLLAAWLGAEYFVLRRVRAMVAATRRLRAGDMTARTGTTGAGELADLARSFDEMADSLQEREAALERSAEAEAATRRTLQAVLDATPVATVAMDRERYITLWPPAAERLFGWSADEIVGRTQPPYVLPECHEEACALATRALGGERLVDVPVRRRCRDGGVLELSLSTAPLLGPDGDVAGVVAVYVDLTVLRQLERQFHHAQKMEAIGRLAGGVAHDFNNLLTAIQGFSEMVLKRDDLHPAVRRDLDEVHKAALRAAALTGQLLAFGRRQPAQPRIVDLNAVVADLTRMLQRVIGEDIRLETRMGARLGRVRVDPGQVEQVVANLVVNARDAMPQGGTLVLETANRTRPGPSCLGCQASCPGSCVSLSVRDTGVGIDDETLPRIFEPFFTTKERGKGTGLGLSTVYGIVQQSGGDVQVDSASGRGTTFHVHFPLAQEQADPDDAGRAAPAAPGGTETVLLVEDEDMVRALVGNTLRKSGYRVLEARHGGEALEVAERHAGRIDLLVTDVVMPGASGPEVARRLAGTRQGLKVLYLSGYPEIERDGGSAVLMGPLLQKPFALEELTRTVREVMDKAA